MNNKTKQYKAFTITMIVLISIFLVAALIMGLADFIWSKKVSNIIFWAWLAYTIAMFAALTIWAIPLRRVMFYNICKMYDFDTGKTDVLQTIFEDINPDISYLEFGETDITINAVSYKYDQLIYQYDSANYKHGVLLYMTNLKDSDKYDVTYIVEVTPPIYQCIKQHNLNSKDLDYFVQELKTKYTKKDLKK